MGAEASPLWRATVGGIGLTGLIERVALRMQRVPSNALQMHKRRIADLDEFLAMFSAQRQTDYVVGWIDATATGKRLGRGILETAIPASQDLEFRLSKKKRIPFDFPTWVLNHATVSMFNAFYANHVPTNGVERTVAYDEFLFPLDAIHDWNKIYGRRGFHQFQCVLPFEAGSAPLVQLLELISSSGRGSFLAVLKSMGARGVGYLSFPMPGYTLALDFPNAPGIGDLMSRLEQITADHGGRVYLAKDATLSPALLPTMYPELELYRAVLDEVDPLGRMNSDLARRLGIRKVRA